MTTPSEGDVAMPFGRYRGRAIADLPHKVLTRLLRAGVGSRLREAVLREVNQRKLDVLHLTALHEASHVVVASLLRVRHGHISIRGARTGKGRSGYMRGLATRSLLVRTRSRHAQIFALKGACISLAPSVLVKVRPTSMLTAAADCITDLRNAHEDLCRVGLSNNDIDEWFQTALFENAWNISDDLVSLGRSAIKAVAAACSLRPYRACRLRKFERSFIEKRMVLGFGIARPDDGSIGVCGAPWTTRWKPPPVV